MDREEELVRRYLLSQGYSGVEHEPDGNVPPDFRVDPDIGVEVRRLNQNYQLPDGSYRGLEEDEIPLLMSVRTLLKSQGLCREEEPSVFFSYRFSRPLPPRRRVKAELEAWLTALPPTHRRIEGHKLACGLEVSLHRASRPLRDRFVLGMTSDWDSGGWVLSETVRNVEICVAEKTVKVRRRLDKYSKWWLALVDYIGYGSDETDRDQIRRAVSVTPPWAKILFINPLEPENSFQVSA